MRRKVNLLTAQEALNDISWVFFLVVLFSFQPHEQLPAAVVLGPGGGCVGRRLGFLAFREGGDAGVVDGGDNLCYEMWAQLYIINYITKAHINICTSYILFI